MDPLTVIHVRERGKSPIENPIGAPPQAVAHYDMITTPYRPIGTGSRVRCHRLEEVPMQNGGGGQLYIAKRPVVVGTVVGIRAMELETTEFIVDNDNMETETTYAYLTVPHIPGVTVRLTWMQWMVRKILSASMWRIRWIAVRHKAAIINEGSGEMDVACGDDERDTYEI